MCPLAFGACGLPDQGKGRFDLGSRTGGMATKPRMIRLTLVVVRLGLIELPELESINSMRQRTIARLHARFQADSVALITIIRPHSIYLLNAATNSLNVMGMRSMKCSSIKRASLRVGSSGRMAQCFCEERLMIW